jgi:fructosamine-3-kinase
VIPIDVRASIEQRLSELESRPVRITADRGVGGGCVSPAARVETDGGTHCFVKWGEPGRIPADLFVEEARSLSALNDAGAVRVPRVKAVGPAWLLLEWLEPGVPSESAWAELGRALATLHRVQAGEFGWASDNCIGPLRQFNGAMRTWPAFWFERRLAPQWEQACAGEWFDAADRRAFERMTDRLDELLAAGDTDGASLLHGDLWSGNAHAMNDGIALIDPSSYHGHREVDLAMTELFGGFDARFHAAYTEAFPLEPGYREARRDIYQLYYLLVHVNLFGAGFVTGTRKVLRKFGG